MDATYESFLGSVGVFLGKSTTASQPDGKENVVRRELIKQSRFSRVNGKSRIATKTPTRMAVDSITRIVESTKGIQVARF